MMKVYGIPNCSSVKKAIEWLTANKIAFEFYDFKKTGITDVKLKEWTQQVDWQLLVNKKGTTWRGLHADVQASITTSKNAITLMKQNTSVIKRPVIETENGLLVGFDAHTYAQKFTVNK